MSELLMIEQTQRWLHSVVVGLNFCPFAQRELAKNSVRFAVCECSKHRDVLEQFLEECQFLDNNQSVETSLLILPKGFSDFFAYLDVLDLVENLLQMENYEGIYQVASFHPEYCFADSDIDDPANFTNRSPYPMFHILREESLEKAIESYKDADKIPENNINQARSLGIEVMKKLFDETKKTPH